MKLGSRASFRRGLSSGVGSFIRPTINVSAPEAAHLLEGLVSVNLYQMGQAVGPSMGAGARGAFPILNGIQNGTVRYDRFDPQEEWKTWAQLMGELRKSGRATGDCEDLSSAVAAEFRFAGIPASTYVYKSGPSLYHVVVKTDKWGLLDPSRASGMEGNG